MDGDTQASTGSLAGKLLVATPALADPNFARSVVLICSHHDGGALGLVLNRPLALPLAQALPAWGDLAAAPAVLFRGGPVEPATVLTLARAQAGQRGAWWTAITAGVGLVSAQQDPGNLPGRLVAARAFSGYAGWAAGQLEAEIEDAGWFVVDAQPGDVFTPEPEQLWRHVLRRQTGQLALMAEFPRDVALN